MESKVQKRKQVSHIRPHTLVIGKTEFFFKIITLR